MMATTRSRSPRSRRSRWTGAASRFPDGVVGQMRDFLQQVGLQVPDIIGVRVLFGGEQFPRPVFATDAVLKDLESLVPRLRCTCRG